MLRLWRKVPWPPKLSNAFSGLLKSRLAHGLPSEWSHNLNLSKCPVMKSWQAAWSMTSFVPQTARAR